VFNIHKGKEKYSKNLELYDAKYVCCDRDSVFLYFSTASTNLWWIPGKKRRVSGSL
jgi:hypothetical protein